jgi:hypothetical protein
MKLKPSLMTFLIAVGTLCTAVSAQELPEGSAIPNAADLKKYLDDRVFTVKVPNGSSWRLEFNARGHYFVNVSTGFKGQGNWRTEVGKLCTALRGDKESCNDVRLVAEVLHMKRDNGQVVQLEPK